MSTDPCVRKSTMPTPPVSGKKRVLEESSLSVESISNLDLEISQTKKIKAALEEQLENIISKQIKEKETVDLTCPDVENGSVENDLTLSDSEVEAENSSSSPGKQTETASSSPVKKINGTTFKESNIKHNEDKANVKVNEETQTKLDLTKKNKIFKSKEFIEETDSESEDKEVTPNPEPPKRSAILIDIRDIKSVSDLQQCSYTLIKGSRKGERCTNRQKSNLCSLHSKEKKEGATSKKQLLEILENTKKENAMLRRENLYLKRSNVDKKKDEIKSEDKNDTMKVKISLLLQSVASLREKNQLLEDNQKSIKKEQLEMTNKISKLEAVIKQFQQTKEVKSTSKITPTTTRSKLNQLNKNQFYKLVAYCGASKLDSKEGMFSSEGKNVRITLPRLLERKDVGEDWGLKFSTEETKFVWHKDEVNKGKFV